VNPTPEPEKPDPTQRVATWAVLLSKWSELARAAVALPPGDRWRLCIAPAIELQAVASALGELDLLDPAERPVALDRAEMAVDRAGRTIIGAWAPDPVPRSLAELVSEARGALAAAERTRGNF